MVEYQKMCHTLVLSKIVKFPRDIFSNCTHCCNPLFKIFQNLVKKAYHHGTLISPTKFFTQDEKLQARLKKKKKINYLENGSK